MFKRACLQDCWYPLGARTVEWKGCVFNEHTHDKGKCERRAAVIPLVSSFVSLVFRQRLGLECLAGSSSPRASRCDLSLVALPWPAGRLL